MSDADSIDEGRFTWASLRPKLARLLDSPSPHIRANLAALAAAMAEDPDAIDELASIGAAAADSIMSQRGDLGEVLSTVLQEREYFDELERKRFDRFLQRHLEREASGWPAPRLAALLREGMPVQLLPLPYVLGAIFESSSSVPVDASTPQEIRDLQDQRSRMGEIVKAADAPDAQEWKDNLANAMARRLTDLDDKQRDAILFGLMELWPELAQAVGRTPVENGRVSLVPAARMGRTGARRLLFPLAASMMAACLVAFALPRLGSLFFEPITDYQHLLLGLLKFVGWAIFLSAVGAIASLPLLFLYTPNALLPVSFLRRLPINLAPVMGSSIIVTFFFALTAVTQSEADLLVQASGLVFLLSMISGSLTVAGTPLLSLYKGRIRRFSRTINGFSASAPPLLVSLVLLVVLQPGNPDVAALVWAYVLVCGLGMGIAAWLSESRRDKRQPKGEPLPAQRSYGIISVGAFALVLLLCLMPLLTVATTLIRAYPVTLDASRPEKILKDGVVYLIKSKNDLYIFQIESSEKSNIDHAVYYKDLKNRIEFYHGWKNVPCSQNRYLAGSTGKVVTQCRNDFDVFNKSLLVCYDCAGKGGSLMTFVQSAWPFRRGNPVTVKAALLIDGRTLHNGDQVRFGEMRSFAPEQNVCLLGRDFKLWKKGESANLGPLVGTDDAVSEDYRADGPNIADSAASATSNTSNAPQACAGVTVKPGQYTICYHAPSAGTDCGDYVGGATYANRPGQAKFQYVPF
jgi:hypothetical protein